MAAGNVFASTSAANGGECLDGLIDAGYNISNDATCGFTAATSINSSPTLDASLRAVAHDVSTDMIEPVAGSPILDQIPPSIAVFGDTITLCTGVDQIGNPRPRAGQTKCAMGAVEPVPTTLYVAAGGTGDCLTPTTPCGSVIGAIGHLGGAGNVINVTGTMDTEVSIDSSDASTANPLTIQHWQGQPPAILDGGNSHGVLYGSSGAVVTVDGLTLRNGARDPGGAILNNGGTVTITGSTFTNNTAPDSGAGGAIFNNGGTVTITGSTFTDNTAPDSGAGGAIFNNGGTVTITSSTFTNNTAAGGSGGAIFSGGTTVVAGNVFAGTSAANGSECAGTPLTDASYNISNDATCGFTAASSVNSSSTLDGSLSALANHGGVTDTIEPLAGSPALDRIPPSTAVNGGTITLCTGVDQNGNPRPQTGQTKCAMGSSETTVVATALAFTNTTAATFSVGTAGSFSATTSGSPAPTLSKSGSLPSGVTFTDNGDGTATLSGTPALGSIGSYPLTLTAANGLTPAATQAFTLTVGKSAQTITFTSSPPATPMVGGTYPVTATGGSSGNPVTFTSGSPTICTITGRTATFLTVGDCVIDANQAGDTNYNPAPQATQHVTVAAAKPGAPTGVAGLPGDGQVTISWDAPSSNGGAPITSYEVTASPGGMTCVAHGALSCIVTGLTNTTGYTFTVAATNSAGAGPASSASVTVTPLNADQAYVTALYQDFLGRAPDSGGFAYWTGLLDNGMNHATLSMVLANTPEAYRFFVNGQYMHILERPADARGLAFWADKLQAHIVSPTTVTVKLYASAEFVNAAGGSNAGWVGRLYTVLLGRSASQAERTYWVQQVQWYGREFVAHVIVTSLEARTNSVNTMFANLLGRSPDADGVVSALDLISHLGERSTAVLISGSNEYAIHAEQRFG